MLSFVSEKGWIWEGQTPSTTLLAHLFTLFCYQPLILAVAASAPLTHIHTLLGVICLHDSLTHPWFSFRYHHVGRSSRLHSIIMKPSCPQASILWVKENKWCPLASGKWLSPPLEYGQTLCLLEATVTENRHPTSHPANRMHSWEHWGLRLNSNK